MSISDSDGRNLLIKTLELISEIKIIFYEILNLYSLQQFYFKENFPIYNKILQIDENKIKIETDPEKLLSQLIESLSAFNSILKKFNSHLSFKYNEFICAQKKDNIFFDDINIKTFLMNNNFDCLGQQKQFHFGNNIFISLKEKEFLIAKYFKKLKIKYFQKNKNNISKEYIQIKIIVSNIFVILIRFSSNISELYEDNIENKIKIKVKGLFSQDNEDFNKSHCNFILFEQLTKIFNTKIKEIIKEMNHKDEGNISFYKCFILFLDYIYDYDKIFKVYCQRCNNKIKFISCDKYFSVPLLKMQKYDDNYISTLINNIENENDINNNKIFHFFHKECVYDD